jgi:hypothetical protein
MDKEARARKGTLCISVRDQFGSGAPIGRAKLSIYARSTYAGLSDAEQESPPEAQKDKKKGKKDEPDLRGCQLVYEDETDANGERCYEGEPGTYLVVVTALGLTVWGRADIREHCREDLCLLVPLDFKIESRRIRDCESHPCDKFVAGETAEFVAQHRDLNIPLKYEWKLDGRIIAGSTERRLIVQLNRTGSPRVEVVAHGSARISAFFDPTVVPQAPQVISGSVGVTLRRTATAPTPDLPLWIVIKKAAEAISFDNYNRFMDIVLCGIGPRDIRNQLTPEFDRLRQRRFLPYNDADAYRLLKVATEAFLIVNCGVALNPFVFTQPDLDDLLSRVSLDGRVIDLNALNTLWLSYLEDVNGIQDATIPYLGLIRDKLRDVGLKSSVFAIEDPSIDIPQECFGILREKLTHPCFLELIWSYWHEEGMLVQTMNALSQRFQNVRGPGDRDPLAMLEIDPLRPLNNLLWGYIQDEQHRLSIMRRVYEYDHHYGLTLYGKAVPSVHPADSRSKFLEAFHNLLYLCTIFFQQDDDTTVIADGFPVLNALKEVHLIVTQGAHNQFGDLPSTARQEMLVQQWILGRPEFREFLPTRIMVAYPERWMDRVDAMKTLQGWTDVSVLHFHNLGVFGEEILLSIRFGAWSAVNDPVQAANWARFWRAEIQGYNHAYRAVTGVDLSSEVTDSRQASQRYLQPSVHLRNRLAMQRQKV